MWAQVKKSIIKREDILCKIHSLDTPFAQQESIIKKEDIFMQNTFIGYHLGTTRKYHKYIDCKSICEKYNNQKSFRGLSLRLAAIE